MKKFEKIVTWIQEEVRSGRMVSGEKLPSEQELSEQFQVSRQTVRRALEELVKENIVESRRGSGSYICEDVGKLLGNTARRADHVSELLPGSAAKWRRSSPRRVTAWGLPAGGRLCWRNWRVPLRNAMKRPLSILRNPMPATGSRR